MQQISLQIRIKASVCKCESVIIEGGAHEINNQNNQCKAMHLYIRTSAESQREGEQALTIDVTR